jgi:hypothetical protein
MADKLTFEQWWATQDIFKNGTVDELAQVIWAAAQENAEMPETAPVYELVPCNYDGSPDAIKALIKGAKLFAANGAAVTVGFSDYGLAMFAGGAPIRYDHLFRREPVRMKTAVYPMPETKAPEVGTRYFSTTSNGAVVQDTWAGSFLDMSCLAAGNVLLKREHASAKAAAQGVEVTK